VLLFALYLLVVGLIAGSVARLLVPGRDPMTLPQTILLGIVGSFVGGFLGWALFGANLDRGAVQAAGVFGSVVGAVIVLLLWRAVSGWGRTHA
jgi:uncharacterized membrane protein YeaQ/YmgE (transglycosylase-associated protein family)